jgi:hypothetical protein
VTITTAIERIGSAIDLTYAPSLLDPCFPLTEPKFAAGIGKVVVGILLAGSAAFPLVFWVRFGQLSLDGVGSSAQPGHFGASQRRSAVHPSEPFAFNSEIDRSRTLSRHSLQATATGRNAPGRHSRGNADAIVAHLHQLQVRASHLGTSCGRW